MKLKIISAEQIMYEGEVSSVTLPGTMGAFTVLTDHASLISTLASGTLAYTTDGGEDTSVQIPGGLVDVDSNVISVCVY